MPYVLSFAADFYVDDAIEAIAPSDRPASVYQAIVSLPQEVRREIARNVFGLRADQLGPELLLAKILDTNTCSNLDDPVEVWIDPDGDYTLRVHARD